MDWASLSPASLPQRYLSYQSMGRRGPFPIGRTFMPLSRRWWVGARSLPLLLAIPLTSGGCDDRANVAGTGNTPPPASATPGVPQGAGPEAAPTPGGGGNP